ncbi:hypothetical protein CULT_1560002 [[Clostridium] ultunense Esp]|nr:hypothetical protein CULT_1560002 [[Clostridium] ultunense Esp]
MSKYSFAHTGKKDLFGSLHL